MHSLAYSQHSEQLASLGQAQLERLAYIDFRLYFLGTVSRQDLKTRFGLAPAGATRDLAQYKEFALGNLEFDNASKLYVVSKNFAPIFVHIAERVMSALSQGFGDGVNALSGSLITCETPPALNKLDLSIVAALSRAIHLRRVISIQYFSGSSGLTQREIVPFALATDGMRWHVRAFDRKRSRFLDFVISRIEQAKLVEDEKPQPHELPIQDHQWNRIVELDLVPHPDSSSSELVLRDYGMSEGILRLKTRAAMAGYILQQWHVDCSMDHHISDEAYRLWLQDPLTLYGVESAKLAPRYGKLRDDLLKEIQLPQRN